MSDARSDIFARIREALKVKAPKPHLKGEPVASKIIRKHPNDALRLSQLLAPDVRIEVTSRAALSRSNNFPILDDASGCDVSLSRAVRHVSLFDTGLGSARMFA